MSQGLGEGRMDLPREDVSRYINGVGEAILARWLVADAPLRAYLEQLGEDISDGTHVEPAAYNPAKMTTHTDLSSYFAQRCMGIAAFKRGKPLNTAAVSLSFENGYLRAATLKARWDREDRAYRRTRGG